MFTRRIALVLTGLLLVVGSRTAPAYTGGPRLVEVLGWDENAQRLYFRTIPQNDGVGFGGVYYFDLVDDRMERIQLPWSAGSAEANDPERNAHLDSLRSQLVPLLPRPEASLGWGTSVVRSESMPVAGGTRTRFRLLFTSARGPRFECTAYERPDACVKDTYEIPGHKERIYVLAFRGNPNDIAETQVAVLVPEMSDRVYQVAWEPDP